MNVSFLHFTNLKEIMKLSWLIFAVVPVFITLSNAEGEENTDALNESGVGLDDMEEFDLEALQRSLEELLKQEYGDDYQNNEEFKKMFESLGMFDNSAQQDANTVSDKAAEKPLGEEPSRTDL